LNSPPGSRQKAVRWWAASARATWKCCWNRALPGTLTIQVQTSVNGAEQRWQHLFERIFQEQTPPALNIDIHDFAATPGVVRLRLEQGCEEIGHD